MKRLGIRPREEPERPKHIPSKVSLYKKAKGIKPLGAVMSNAEEVGMDGNGAAAKGEDDGNKEGEKSGVAEEGGWERKVTVIGVGWLVLLRLVATDSDDDDDYASESCWS